MSVLLPVFRPLWQVAMDQALGASCPPVLARPTKGRDPSLTSQKSAPAPQPT